MRAQYSNIVLVEHIIIKDKQVWRVRLLCAFHPRGLFKKVNFIQFQSNIYTYKLKVGGVTPLEAVIMGVVSGGVRERFGHSTFVFRMRRWWKKMGLGFKFHCESMTISHAERVKPLVFRRRLTEILI